MAGNLHTMMMKMCSDVNEKAILFNSMSFNLLQTFANRHV